MSDEPAPPIGVPQLDSGAAKDANQLPVGIDEGDTTDTMVDAPAAPTPHTNASLAYLRELVASCRAHIRPADPAPSCLNDIRQTAESLEEVRRAATADERRAPKAARGEDGAGHAAALASTAITDAEHHADDSVESDCAALAKQLRRLQLYRHALHLGGDGAPAVPRVVRTDKVATDVLCATALLQGSATGSLDGQKDAELVGEVVSAVCESNALDCAGPAAAIWRAQVVRFTNMARGYGRVERSAEDVESARRSLERRQPDQRGCALPKTRAAIVATSATTGAEGSVSPVPTVAVPTSSAPPAPSDVEAARANFVQVWAAKQYSVKRTGITSAVADSLVSRFGAGDKAVRARLRFFMESVRMAMHPGTVLNTIPQAERKWRTKCPLKFTEGPLELPSVTDVHPDLTPEWNVGTVLLVLLPLTQPTCPAMVEKGTAFRTMYRVLATNLRGQPCYVTFAAASPADAVARFIDDAPAAMTDSLTSPVFIASRDLSGVHPRILAVTNNCTPEQAKLIDRLHAPAARLAKRVEEFSAVTTPPKASFGPDELHRDAIMAIARIENALPDHAGAELE